MLTCIACSKQVGAATASSRDVSGGVESPIHDPDDEDVADGDATPSTRQAIKALTSQIRDMALKASGGYRHCKPCAGAAAGSRRRPHRRRGYADSEVGSGSERFRYAYQRAGMSSESTPRAAALEREVEVRLKAISIGERTPSVSGRTEAASAFLEESEEEPKEWVAQVEPGVLITFLSIPQGGNDLKRIHFSREMFNKWQAQRWWAENCDKVIELYNVQRFNRQIVPLSTLRRSEDEVKEECQICSKEDSFATPPLGKELLPHNLHRPLMGDGGIGYSSSDSFDQHQGCRGHSLGHPRHARHYYDSGCLTSTPKRSSISGARTETSSMDASVRTCSSPDEVEHSGEISVSISNASDLNREWVEEDEPGVYITIRELPGGIRELQRIRFSRERFGEMAARLWWEENRTRIQEEYL
ncbi:protein Brevis radix-like 1 isoform X1 [Zingiber officinale]|uniref:protein Brevis radix-like 1 isoform X1 n=1 Tax=Zingiber officinale TaxID=94328 RepID=UPI001C4ADAA5|nr:protein Brevis radix-like 1 isoform X1 [Zingiber officinale]